MIQAAGVSLRVALRCRAGPARSAHGIFGTTRHVLPARRASTQPNSRGPQMAGPENESVQSADDLAAEEADPFDFPDVPRASHHLYTDSADAAEAQDQPHAQPAPTSPSKSKNSQPIASHWKNFLRFDWKQSELPVWRLDIISPSSHHAQGYLKMAVVRKNLPARIYRLSPLAIRDLCRSEESIDPSSRQRRYQTTDISPDIRMRAISNHNCPAGFADILFRDGKVVRISLVELLKYVREDCHPDSRPSVSGWSSASYQTYYDAGLVRASFKDFVNNPVEFKKILAALSAHGLAFIHDMPDSETAVEELAETIGPLRHTFYGRTWDVKDKPNAENVAYTSGYLGLHMDLLYMKEPPGLQFLHCLRSSDEGGESLFADSFKAIRRMMASDPELVDVLAEFPITYGYEHGDKGLYFRDTKPVIEIDKHAMESYQGSVEANLNTTSYLPVKNVNWSPPFQNSFSFTVDPGVKRPSRLLRWHHAAKMFSDQINHPKNMFSHKLKPGECVVFANRRVLHGRNRFVSQPGSGERFLKGAYVDTDDFESKLRSAFLYGTEHNFGQGLTHFEGRTFDLLTGFKWPEREAGDEAEIDERDD